MALTPEYIEAVTRPMNMPLTTGFTYRRREDVPDFELPAEVLAEMEQQLKRFEHYRIPPANHHQIIARGIGSNAIEGTE
jgi:hypothetical protein